MNISPQFLRERFFENNRGKVHPMIGSARSLILNSPSPSPATSQLVTVVPTFAPRMTPMEPTRSSKPAFTKLTTMTVVADELWISAVMKIPVRTPVMRLEVIAVRI